MRKLLVIDRSDLVHDFAAKIPNAVKFTVIPSQDKVDVYFDNIHAQEFKLSDILAKAKQNAKNQGFDLVVKD